MPEVLTALLEQVEVAQFVFDICQKSFFSAVLPLGQVSLPFFPDSMTRSVPFHNHQLQVFTEGSGAPLVFLHGWPTNSRLWQSQVAAFRSTYRVITLDWLGFGRSDKPEGYHYTFTGMQKVLDTVLTQVLSKAETVALVAHDIGGPAAIRWAHAHPERVRRLVLLNTILFPFRTPLDRLSHVAFEVPLLNRFLVSNVYLKLLMKTLSQRRGQDVSERIATILRWPTRWSSAIKLRTILEPVDAGKSQEIPSLAAQLIQTKVDKYLIVAEQDPLCYAHMKQLTDRYPTLPTYTIDRCGHYLPLDRPDELNAILRTILADDEENPAH